MSVRLRVYPLRPYFCKDSKEDSEGIYLIKFKKFNPRNFIVNPLNSHKSPLYNILISFKDIWLKSIHNTSPANFHTQLRSPFSSYMAAKGWKRNFPYWRSLLKINARSFWEFLKWYLTVTKTFTSSIRLSELPNVSPATNAMLLLLFPASLRLLYCSVRRLGNQLLFVDNIFPPAAPFDYSLSSAYPWWCST